MKINWYSIESGHLQEVDFPQGWSGGTLNRSTILWAEVRDADLVQLKEFLAPLDIHPLQLDRCLDTNIEPGVLTVGDTIMMEYPASLINESSDQAFLTILIRENLLLTVRHGTMSALDDLVKEFVNIEGENIHHLPQVIYEILDRFADLNVDAQMQIRERILDLSRIMNEKPSQIDGKSISTLKLQAGNLISLIENQLYCVSRLAASDIAFLKDTHRKAYIDDIISEVEIARQGIYRLENRINDLYDEYQLIGSDRMERRLRLLTIVSAITLPLGLIAGLLGMNVGGIPGINAPAGFLIVIILMVIVGVVQYIFFKRHGWFE